MTTPADILDFWFRQIEPTAWWQKDSEFDALVQSRFGDTLASAAQAELTDWRGSLQGRLAEIIVLDQFSRNVYRDTPAAFAQDAMALVLAQEAIRAGALQQLNEQERTFLLMPYMHSESVRIHQQAEELFRVHTPAGNYDFELRHKVIIDRFGRYPHRNDILARPSTAEEREFLLQPDSSF